MGDIGPGTVIGGLRIDAVAGRGGMGVVYRATQLALDRTVAVKVVAPELSDDPEFRERFQRESQLAASIDHPHVVPVYHAGEEDGRLYVSMRFVEGTDLRQLLHARGPLDPRRAAEIVTQVAGALDAAHARGLVHRDVKPANILIAAGDRVQVYLTDFGLTKRQAGADSGLTRTGALMGTVDYIAPEQLEGRPVDARVDVYALGCVLFEALTGSVPFPRDSDAAKMWAHMGVPPPSPAELVPHLPRELDEVLRRAMAKRPEDRYPTAGALAMALNAAVAAPAAVPVTAAGLLTAPPSGGPRIAPAPGRAPSPPAGSRWPGQPVPPGSPSYPGAVAYPVPAGSPAGGYPPFHGGPPPARSRTAAVLGVVGALLAVVLVAGGVLVYANRTPPPPPGPRPAGEIIGTPLATGAQPSSLVEGGGFLWTANTDTISKIDPRTGSSREITVGGIAITLAVDQGAVWVQNADTSVVRVDIATEAVSDPIPTGDAPIYYIAAGGGYLWISHHDANTVGRLDMQTRQIEGTVAVGKGPGSMQYDNGLLYVVNELDATLTTIDGTTGEVVGQPLAVPQAGGGIRIVDRILYLGTTDSVTPVDEATFAIGRPIALQGGAFFAVGAGSLWVSYPTENVIRRFHLETGQQQDEPIRGVGKDISTLEFFGGELLALNQQLGTVTRIRPAT